MLNLHSIFQRRINLTYLTSDLQQLPVQLDLQQPVGIPVVDLPAVAEVVAVAAIAVTVEAASDFPNIPLRRRR